MKTHLTEEERAKIIEEETLRAEVRKDYAQPVVEKVEIEQSLKNDSQGIKIMFGYMLAIVPFVIGFIWFMNNK